MKNYQIKQLCETIAVYVQNAGSWLPNNPPFYATQNAVTLISLI